MEFKLEKKWVYDKSSKEIKLIKGFFSYMEEKEYNISNGKCFFEVENNKTRMNIIIWKGNNVFNTEKECRDAIVEAKRSNLEWAEKTARRYKEELDEL